MQKEENNDPKDTLPSDPPKSSAKKIEIPKYSDKFKDIIAKSELARQQNSKPKEEQ